MTHFPCRHATSAGRKGMGLRSLELSCARRKAEHAEQPAQLLHVPRKHVTGPGHNGVGLERAELALRVMAQS